MARVRRLPDRREAQQRVVAAGHRARSAARRGINSTTTTTAATASAQLAARPPIARRRAHAAACVAPAPGAGLMSLRPLSPFAKSCALVARFPGSCSCATRSAEPSSHTTRSAPSSSDTSRVAAPACAPTLLGGREGGKEGSPRHSSSQRSDPLSSAAGARARAPRGEDLDLDGLGGAFLELFVRPQQERAPAARPPFKRPHLWPRGEGGAAPGVSAGPLRRGRGRRRARPRSPGAAPCCAARSRSGRSREPPPLTPPWARGCGSGRRHAYSREQNPITCAIEGEGLMIVSVARWGLR